MANTLDQFGAQSATFTVPVVGEESGSLTVADWSALPSGKLRSLLNRKYLSNAGTESEAPDLAAFADAYAKAGGSVILSRKVPNLEEGGLIAIRGGIYMWQIDEAGYPTLVDDTGGASDFIARIQVSYSASE